MLLTKGFELEMFLGTPQGDPIPLAEQIVGKVDRFMQETDERHIEYTTEPLHSYEQLLSQLILPRIQLREYLKTLGDYTVIPGSTLSLGRSDRFYRSGDTSPYLEYIERNHGSNVVTASVHINIGFSDPELLIRACRLIKMEAPLYLALSASSPFLDDHTTGYHSTRWHILPHSQYHIPLFENHAEYIEWVEGHLAAGTMFNVRHHWDNVRPNGDRRPYDINRLELRICDLVTDPTSLLAITALLEARLWQLVNDPNLDPLEMSQLPAATRKQDLIDLTKANEAAVKVSSLDAELRHWQDGRKILARNWINEIYNNVLPLVKQQGFENFLSPVQTILQAGNTAQKWLKMYAQGADTRSIITQAIQEMAKQELDLANQFGI
jgi:predicted glutamate--cysteine ligase